MSNPKPDRPDPVTADFSQPTRVTRFLEDYLSSTPVSGEPILYEIAGKDEQPPAKLVDVWISRTADRGLLSWRAAVEFEDIERSEYFFTKRAAKRWAKREAYNLVKEPKTVHEMYQIEVKP